MPLHSLENIKDEFVGKRGASNREEYEQELQLDILGDLIKNVRL